MLLVILSLLVVEVVAEMTAAEAAAEVSVVVQVLFVLDTYRCKQEHILLP